MTMAVVLAGFVAMVANIFIRSRSLAGGGAITIMAGYKFSFLYSVLLRYSLCLSARS